MSKIIISTDSISDLGEEILQKYEIPVFPLVINMGEISKEDYSGMPEEIYAYVAKTGKTPKTAARGESEYEAFFSSLKKDADEIVHFTISSKLSVSYENAIKAAKKIGGVYVVNTCSLSTGAGLCVMYALDLKSEGVPAKEIAEKCIARTGFAQASFVVNSLEYLHKGGRCSGVALLFSNILNIKPMILLKNGEMVVGKKYMAKFEKAVDRYVDDILNTYSTPDLKRVFITHTELTAGIAERVKIRVLDRYKFEEVYDTVAGGTVTSHCGKNTIGVLYFNDGNKN